MLKPAILLKIYYFRCKVITLFPRTIDKPTRVSTNSATSGNIISDISDYYSQFCIIKSFKIKKLPKKNLYRKFSQATEENNKHLMTGPKGNSEFCFVDNVHNILRTLKSYSHGADLKAAANMQEDISRYSL